MTERDWTPWLPPRALLDAGPLQRKKGQVWAWRCGPDVVAGTADPIVYRMTYSDDDADADGGYAKTVEVLCRPRHGGSNCYMTPGGTPGNTGGCSVLVQDVGQPEPTPPEVLYEGAHWEDWLDDENHPNGGRWSFCCYNGPGCEGRSRWRLVAKDGSVIREVERVAELLDGTPACCLHCGGDKGGKGYVCAGCVKTVPNWAAVMSKWDAGERYLPRPGAAPVPQAPKEHEHTYVSDPTHTFWCTQPCGHDHARVGPKDAVIKCTECGHGWCLEAAQKLMPKEPTISFKDATSVMRR